MIALYTIPLILSCQNEEINYALSSSPPKESEESLTDTSSIGESNTIDSGLVNDTIDENTEDGSNNNLPEENDTALPENDDNAEEITSTNPFDVDSLSVCGASNIGFEVGDCAQNFVLKDDTNSNIYLHNYIGNVIFLDLSSFS